MSGTPFSNVNNIQTFYSRHTQQNKKVKSILAHLDPESKLCIAKKEVLSASKNGVKNVFSLFPRA